MTSMTLFPAELCDLVISFCEPEVLKITSLVCQQWLVPSRRTFLPDLDIHRFNVKKFLRLAESPKAKFHLIKYSSVTVNDRDAHATYTIDRILHSISRLTTRKLILYVLRYPELEHFSDLRASVEHLTLHFLTPNDGYHVSYRYIDQLLPTFPNVTYLILLYPNVTHTTPAVIYSPVESQIQPESRHSKISSFVLIPAPEACTFPFISPLIRCIRPERLHLIELSHVEDTPNPLVNILRTIGDRLQHLALGWMITGARDRTALEVLDSLDMSTCSNVRSMFFDNVLTEEMCFCVWRLLDRMPLPSEPVSIGIHTTLPAAFWSKFCRDRQRFSDGLWNVTLVGRNRTLISQLQQALAPPAPSSWTAQYADFHFADLSMWFSETHLPKQCAPQTNSQL